MQHSQNDLVIDTSFGSSGREGIKQVCTRTVGYISGYKFQALAKTLGSDGR